METTGNTANSNEIENSTISTPSIAENSNDFDGFLDETPSIGENQNTSIENILASKSNLDDGLEHLNNIRKKYLANPLLGYLNINSLRGDKFLLLKDIITENPIEVLCIDETKLSYDYTDAQFLIDGYQFPPFRRDRTYEKFSFTRGWKNGFY